MFKCSAGVDSPRRDLSGLTSGVLLVLLAEDPDIDAWTDATTFACSGGTYLTINICVAYLTHSGLKITVSKNHPTLVL